MHLKNLQTDPFEKLLEAMQQALLTKDFTNSIFEDISIPIEVFSLQIQSCMIKLQNKDLTNP